MAVRESAGSGLHPSLYSSLRSLWGVALAIVYTRLDLLTAELEDEATRAVRLIVVSLASLLCVGMALFFLMFFLVAAFWETAYRLPILGGVFLVYALASVVLLLIARNMVLRRPERLQSKKAHFR